MNIDTQNDEKSLNLNNIESQNTPSYQGSTVNTLSNRDKKNIKNIIKNHKIQITDSDLTSQDLKSNFNLNKHKFIKTETCDISPKNPLDDLSKFYNHDKTQDLALNNFEDTFSKNKINLKSCINLTSSNSKKFSNFNEINYENQKEISRILSTDIAKNNYSNNKRHHISRSIDNSCTDRAHSPNYTDIYNYRIQSTKNPGYSNNKTLSEINNINNSSSIILTSDIEYNLNKTSNCDNVYKNSEKTIDKDKSILDSGVKHYNNDNTNKSSYKNKLNLKLNNKHLLKKSHNRKISINISSIQSPDHRAVYKIENIEKDGNGEIKYEGFKGFNKSGFKNSQNNLINLQGNNTVNRDLRSGKVKRLFFENSVSNSNNNLNVSVSNNLNDRIQRAISNSPNRILPENNNNNNNKSSINEGSFHKNINKDNLRYNEISKSSIDNSAIKNDNKSRMSTYNKIMVNSSVNFYNKKLEETEAHYKLPPKNKTIEHDEDSEFTVIRQTNTNNAKYTNSNMNNANFITPINRKSRARLNSSENLVSRIDQNKINFLPVAENKNNNYTINYNPKLNFLRERYGDTKFKMLMDLFDNSSDLNKTLNDNEKIRSIVGEDYKIAKSFLKNISNEIFPNRIDSPSKTII